MNDHLKAVVSLALKCLDDISKTQNFFKILNFLTFLIFIYILCTLENRENVLIFLSPTLKLARYDEKSEFTYWDSMYAVEQNCFFLFCLLCAIFICSANSLSPTPLSLGLNNILKVLNAIYQQWILMFNRKILIAQINFFQSTYFSMDIFDLNCKKKPEIVLLVQ